MPQLLALLLTVFCIAFESTDGATEANRIVRRPPGVSSTPTDSQPGG